MGTEDSENVTANKIEAVERSDFGKIGGLGRLRNRTFQARQF